MSEKKTYYAPMHTTEHILNRTMVNMFGCGRSENCHIERKKSKCDFRLDTEPTQEQIKEIEKKVNEVINSRLDVTEHYLSFQEASERFPLHRISDAENQLIRIISVGIFDDCPCIGEHVSNTSEIGVFRIISASYSEGIFRIRFKL